MTEPVGLIETLRVREGRMPLLERHLARLHGSIAALGVPRAGRDPADLVRPFADMGEAVVRIEVTAGRVAVTVRGVAAVTPPAVITARVAHESYPHKTTARRPFDAAAAEARAAGADDALLLTGQGYVAEGTAWNVCWWEGDRVQTPALGLGVLPGIGRGRVAELVTLEEVSATPAALGGRSLFLVNAVRGVVPLATLDGRGVPGNARTAELSRGFWPD